MKEKIDTWLIEQMDKSKRLYRFLLFYCGLCRILNEFGPIIAFFFLIAPWKSVLILLIWFTWQLCSYPIVKKYMHDKAQKVETV